MKALTVNKIVRCWLAAAILPVTLMACSSDDDSKLVQPGSDVDNQITMDAVTLDPVEGSLLGAFTEFETFTVSGLADGKEALLKVSPPFTFKVMRNGEVRTLRSTQLPDVADAEIFFKEKESEITEGFAYVDILPVGFTNNAMKVQNGDIVTIGTVASTLPNTSLSGQAMVGLTAIDLEVETGEADTTPSFVFDAELFEQLPDGSYQYKDALGAVPGEELTVKLFVRGIDYTTPFSIVSDTTTDAEGNPTALFTIGFDEETLSNVALNLDSTIQKDTQTYEQFQESEKYLFEYYDEKITRETEQTILKEAQDGGLDQAWIDNEMATRIPPLLEAKHEEIELAVRESYDKYLLGEHVILKATAPDAYNEAAEVSFEIGTRTYTLSINTNDDTVADPIEFNQPEVTAAKGETFKTSGFTVARINQPSPISITNGEYSLDGGSNWLTTGTVEEGDKVLVRVTASDTFDDTVTATLTIGGESAGSVSLVTESQDLVPDAFDFGDKFVEEGIVVQSDAVTIEGFNDDTDISISGGDAEFSLDGGITWITDGTLSPDQAVIARMTSPAKDTDLTATITVGGVSGEYTIFSTDPLEGQVLFPPKYSMTESDSIYLRGSLTPFGTRTVDSVTVNGEAITTFDDNGWSATVSGLEEGENSIKIEAIDSALVPFTAEVIVTKKAATESFGSGVPLYALQDVTINADGDSVKYYIASSNTKWKGVNKSIEMDIEGNRTLFADISNVSKSHGPNGSNGGGKNMGLQYIPGADSAIFSNQVDRSLFIVPTSGDAASREAGASLLTTHVKSAAGSGPNMEGPEESALDSERNLVVVGASAGKDNGIFTVNLDTGERIVKYAGAVRSVAVDVDGTDGNAGDSYFFAPTSGTVVKKIDLTNCPDASTCGDSDITNVVTGLLKAESLAVNQKENVLLVGDSNAKQVIKVDLTTGDEMVLTNGVTGDNPFVNIKGIAADESLGYLVLIADNNSVGGTLEPNGNEAVLAVDIETGHRVYINKNANP